MHDTAPQTADGKVLWHFAMSLDGFVAGPDHAMDWMATGVSFRPGLVQEYVATTGAVLAGRDGWDRAIDAGRPSAWSASTPTAPRRPSTCGTGPCRSTRAAGPGSQCSRPTPGGRRWC